MTFQARVVRASAKALAAVLFAALFFFGLQAPMAQAVGGVDLTVSVTTKAGTAITGLEVVAYEVEDHHSDFSQFEEGTVLSGAPAGRYLIQDLELNQDYALYFYVNNNPTSFDQFYGGTTWVEEATLLRWTSAGNETLSVTLATNTNITGKVSISSTTGLASVWVTAYRFDGTGWYDVAQVKTSSTGTYALRNLEPGSYRLGFQPNNLKGYAPRFSGGATTLQNASSIYAGLGTTTTSNMTLAVGAKISGTVGLFPFDFNSAGIVPVAYRLLGDALNGYHGIDKSEFYVGPAVASGCTGLVVHCKWTVPGLPTGGYVVKLYDFSGLLPYYEPMWVDSNDGTDKAAQAGIFTVTAPASVTDPVSTVLFTEGDINVTSLDITVLDPSSNPVEDALVSLYSDDNNDFQLDVATDALGIARFDRIGEGDFVAEITTDDAATLYHPDYNEFTISGTGDHDRTFTLAPVTSFGFTAPATVSWSNTNVGSQFDAVVPPTTMDNGSGVEQDVDYDYQWYRGDTAIFGAQGDSYVTKSGDVNSTVSVVVTASTFGFPDITEVANAGAQTALGDAAVSTGLPVITSPAAAKPGVVLSASTGTWDLPGLRYSYQWKLDGTPILGATGRTYAAKHADASHALTVEVTAKKPGLNDSLPAATAPIAVGQLPAPVVTKNSAVTTTTTGLLAGQTKYTISMGTWSVPGASWHVNWYVDGVQELAPVSGANSQTFLFDANTYVGNPVAPAVQAVVVVDKLGYTTGAKSYLVRRGGVPTQTVAGGVTPPWSSTPFTDSDNVSWGDPLNATAPVLGYPTMTGNTVATSYLWQRKTGTTWATIPKATAATYVSTAADMGHLLRVRVTTTSNMYGTDTAYLSGGFAMGKWDIVGGLQPLAVVNGTDDVTAKKSVQVVGSWPISGVTQTYQWYTCDPAVAVPDCDNVLNHNWTAVAGATAASWTPPASLANKRVAAAVKGSKSGYVSLTIHSDGMLVLADPPDELSYLADPKISAGLLTGNAVVGRTLTAAVGMLDVAGATRVYTWEYSTDSGSNWNPIPGVAHALTYVPSAAFQDANPSAWIRFAESASKPGLGSDSAASPGYPLVPAALVPSVKPTVSGNATTGYVVNTGTWPAGTSFDVEWRENGVYQVTSTGPHVYIPAAPGTVVTATVMAYKAGYTAAPIRLVPRKGTATFTASALNGATVGDTFSVSSPGFSFSMGAPEATYSYQWYSNNVAITGDKSPTFVASSTYLNKNLSLRVTMSSPLFTTLVGPHTPVLVAAHSAPAGSPNLTSAAAARPGVKLTVIPGTYTTTGLAFTYVIQRSTNGGGVWSNVTTSSSYTLTTTDAGTLFRALVTAKKGGWVTSVLATPNVAVGWLGPLDTVGPLTINGTGAVGSALSVAPVWNAMSVTVTYRWLRNGVTIPGVTGTTFTPLASSFGDEIDVVINASKAGYQPVVVTSNTVKVGEAVAPAPVATTPPVISGATGGTNLPKVGNVLAASMGAWNVDGLTFSYQWRAAGVDIPNADGPTYTVTLSEQAKAITVVVTTHKAGWANGTSTSKPTLATIP